jgi:hypothetical protein
LLVGGGAWWWHGRPVTLRLVATLAVSREFDWTMLPLFFGEPGGLYLRVERPATVTLIGWDGQPRWTIHTPVGRRVNQELDWWLREVNPMIASLSPDGRLFALARVRGASLLVNSWRDGRPLGQALVPCLGARHPDILLHVTDSGRVWVCDRATGSTTCRLWAVDGARVAVGGYHLPQSLSPLRRSNGTLSALSPNGTHLACYHSWGRLDYLALAVQGDRVRATRCYSVPTNDVDAFWVDDARLRVFAATHSSLAHDWEFAAYTLLGPAGTQARVPERRPGDPRWLYPVSGPAWTPGGQDLAHTPDQRLALGLAPSPLPAPLERLYWWAIGHRLLQQPTVVQLGVYSAPGRLRAVLPRCRAFANAKRGAFFFPQFALSPDGQHIAILLRTEKAYQVQLYAWGQ